MYSTPNRSAGTQRQHQVELLKFQFQYQIWFLSSSMRIYSIPINIIRWGDFLMYKQDAFVTYGITAVVE